MNLTLMHNSRRLLELQYLILLQLAEVLFDIMNLSNQKLTRKVTKEVRA